MRFRDWVWVYLGMGESFTRWAILLFYGGAALLVTLVVLAATIALSKL